MRIAYLTDIHLNSKEVSEQGLIRCLETVHALDPRPGLIINGGDTVRDALKDEESVVFQQWKKYREIISLHASIPVKSILGNHDICAFVPVENARKTALEQLELSTPYYSFSQGGWKFIVLDSTHTKADGSWYKAMIGEEQFRWLESELKLAVEPVCIISHIPVLSACVFLDGDNVAGEEWRVPGGWMHLDAQRLTSLFSSFPHVKLCLSGHIHLYEKLEYNGVTYICNGAVSGNWWQGSYRQTAPGFGLFDFYPDGSFQHSYLIY